MKVMMDELLQRPTGKQWERIGVKTHHGINLPLSALHSANSCGIGEFTDLIPLIDWCRDLGMDIIQLLPLNDTGFDNSPYNAISAYALHPIYLGLTQLPYLEESVPLQQMLPSLQRLTARKRVPYHEVLEGKERFLHAYWNLFSSRIVDSEAYHNFKKNNPWLLVHALFKVFKELHKGQSWEQWAPELRNPNNELIEQWTHLYEKEAEYHIGMQFLCFEQMKRVRDYAIKQGVWLQGDIPILISKDSAEVWRYRQFFVMEMAAGSPPDVYSAHGQNWGFPIYNWEALKQANYSWWRERLRVADMLYQLYRIDHIVGFFRIWAIPAGKEGNDGYFVPSDSALWVPQGEALMKMMIESSNMLPIGEDLGVVPSEVRECLNRLGICGTKVMRWERRWQGDKNFIPSKEYNRDSVTTVSTHDSETLALWWRDCPEEAALFCQSQGWNYNPHLTQEQRDEILQQSHQSGSLFHVNLLQEYLALFPALSWPMPEDDRINVPGVISDRNWTYRFKPSIEELKKHDRLMATLRRLIS